MSLQLPQNLQPAKRVLKVLIFFQMQRMTCLFGGSDAANAPMLGPTTAVYALLQEI